MKTVSAKYARQNFAEIINEVHFGKKKIMITKSGKPMVILTSTKEQQKKKR
ncbi:MAG: type II toxin-antitoxin system Phd/YefM family antitoxin [Candidatus Levybacteria bacterium]|nr:type II toxin-antitoxin system Phd/YefM family antitoxin [Candidatus Levybacteria bacterium]